MANYKDRNCRDCHKPFKPNSGAQLSCDPCKAKSRNKYKETKDPRRGLAVGISRGESLRNTPLALRLEESVRRRVERLPT